MRGMKFSHPKALAATILAGGLLPLLFVLFAQYALQLPPCHFCLLQRYPYVLVVLCGAVLWRYPAHAYLLTAFAIIGWLATAGIGLYHTGVEQGWVEYTGACVASTDPTASMEELREQIASAPHVSCDQPMGTFFFLSMASWNALTALGWITLTLYIYRKRDA